MDDALVVGVRWGLYLTLSATFGVPLFAVLSIAPTRRDVFPLRTIVGLSAAAALMLSLLSWVSLTAAMAGKPIAGVTRDDLTAMIDMPGLGVSWLMRIGSLGLLLLGTSIAGLRRIVPAIGGVLGGVALSSLAWVGHGAAGEGAAGRLHLVADVVHLLAAGAWIGALLALALLLWRTARQPALAGVAYDGLAGFGQTGTFVVAAIVATGLVNTWVLVGPDRVLSLSETLWGQFLLAKLALFTAMLSLAGYNRWVLTPALKRELATATSAGISRLRRSVLVEAGAALVVLALVAWLGTLSPPAFD